MTRRSAEGEPQSIEPDREEVRVAMALNGGVSLAVWMGGCAVELDCARRGHIAEEDLGYVEQGERVEPRPGATASRRVYHGLCTAFRRRLVLDILTGASAGGINGALLAAVMRGPSRLHPGFVRDKWLELGEFSKLLQDRADPAPRSLMQGEVFYKSLVDIFRDLLGDDDEPVSEGPTSLPAGQRSLPRFLPKLEVTITDVEGERLEFVDEWGNELIAREHRARVRFHAKDDYSIEALAAAARTSASFPGAFEPFLVADATQTLSRLASPRYAIDGGVLDNAPIRVALDLIPTRRAWMQVSRHVCYLNADPPTETPEAENREAPDLQQVIGYAVNLPRVSPFVDQLYAVRQAVQGCELSVSVQADLLSMSLEALEATATALLPAYRKRKTALSLQELLGDPAQASIAAQNLDPEASTLRLPWVPGNLDGGERWWWGARPAQRVLHLMLDLIRPRLIKASNESERLALLEARTVIDEQLERLDELLYELHEDNGVVGVLSEIGEARVMTESDEGPASDEAFSATRARVGALGELTRDYAARIRDAVHIANSRLAQLVETQTQLFDVSLREALFGSPRDSASSREGRFLRRALAIETVRQASASGPEIEPAQGIRFAQMTPFSPARIFTARPFHEHGPCIPEQKLLGTKVGHFGGFYRSSWRANDYMWGRLDAAGRVVEMLLDRPPDSLLQAAPGASRPAETIRDAILPEDAREDERWLAHEALMDWLAGDYPLPRDPVPPAAALRPLLLEAIEEEVEPDTEAANTAEGEGRTTEDMPFTRVVCARAAQLEVLRDELPVLVEQSQVDFEAGSGTLPLQVPVEAGTRNAILALRSEFERDEYLPKKLCGRGEEVSDLALRTIGHAAFVGVSAVQAEAKPFRRPLAVFRPPLLTLAGAVTQNAWYKRVLWLGFWASALFIASRLLTIPAEAPKDPELSLLWSKGFFVSLIALAVIVGLSLVPAVRAGRDVRPGFNWACALLLAGSGVVGAALLAFFAGNLNLPQLIFAPGSEPPPAFLLDAALASTLLVSAVRLPFASRLPVIGPRIQALAPAGWVGPVSGGILTAVALAVIVVSLIEIANEGDGELWRSATILLAIVVAPIVSLAYLFRFARHGVTTKSPRDRLDEMPVSNSGEVQEREPEFTPPFSVQGDRPPGT